MTPAQRDALEFIRDNQPVGAFPFPLDRIRRAEKAGLIEVAGKEPGVFGFITYQLTDAGRAALSGNRTNGETEK